MNALPVVVLTGMAMEARIAAGRGASVSAPEVVFGLRAEALALALAPRLRQPCAGLISFGYAGGQLPGWDPGAVLVAHGVVHGSGMLATDPTWSAVLRAMLPDAGSGLLAGVDAPQATLAAKRALQQATGAVAVDMESHIGARLAHAAGVPFAVCRVILDPAQRAVPPAALAAFGTGGSGGAVAGGALLRELLRRPAQLPALLQLAADAARARSRLRGVREELGERFGR